MIVLRGRSPYLNSSPGGTRTRGVGALGTVRDLESLVFAAGLRGNVVVPPPRIELGTGLLESPTLDH